MRTLGSNRRSGTEVDFHAHLPNGRRELIQVYTDLIDRATRQRELSLA